MTQVAPAFDAPPSQGEDEGPGGDAALPASLFPVPRVPKIGRHKEPRPFHKSAPGYDMKTLRRQLEGMYEDLEERYLLQRALYSQNEQLWAYAASLLELNRSYSTQTAEHLGKLHNRFQLLQDERESICMRLIEAQMVYCNLMDQKAAADDLKEALGMHHQRRAALLAELDRVNEENEQLEGQLQQQAAEVLKFHHELQEVSLTKAEDELLERADTHFFVTSTTTLRGAFRRFQERIARSRAVRSVVSLLRQFYHVYLVNKTFQSWGMLLLRKQTRDSLEDKRVRGAAVNCFTRWKTFTALEAHFRAKGVQRTMRVARVILHKWRDLTAEQRWCQWADGATKAHQSKLLVKHVFRAWKKATMFLPWTGDWLRVPLQLAQRHYKRQLLGQWRRVACRGMAEDRLKVIGVRELILKKTFANWKNSKLSVPAFARSGKLRFLRVLGDLCSDKAADLAAEHRAGFHDQAYRCRLTLWRLYHMSRARAKRRAFERKLVETALDREAQRWRNTVRFVLYLWGARSTYLRRALLANHLSIDFRRRSMLKSGITKLKLLTGLFTKGNFTLSASERNARWALLLWRRRAVLRRGVCRRTQALSIQRADERRGTRSATRLRQIYELADTHNGHVLRKRYLPAYFGYWLERAMYFRGQLKAERAVVRRARNIRARRCFFGWRCLWVKRLCWRMKAASIDQSELFAQINMQQSEWESMNSERVEVMKYIDEVKTAIDRMKKAVSEKEEDVEHARLTTEGNEVACHKLQLENVDAIAALQQSKDERQRATYMEEILAKEALLEQERARETTEAAAALLMRLNREAEDMRQRVQEARTRVEDTEARMAEITFDQEESLAEALGNARSLHELAEKHTKDLEGSQEIQRVLESTVDSIRSRLEGLGEEGDTALSEEQTALRRKTAEVRALRLNTTQTEAKVAAMRRFKEQRYAEVLERRKRQTEFQTKVEIDMIGQRSPGSMPRTSSNESDDYWVHRSSPAGNSTHVGFDNSVYLSNMTPYNEPNSINNSGNVLSRSMLVSSPRSPHAAHSPKKPIRDSNVKSAGKKKVVSTKKGGFPTSTPTNAATKPAKSKKASSTITLRQGGR